MARILIVDDERPIRASLADILQAEGHTTGEAADGQEALKQLEAEAWDLVLLDIKMPKKDGLEVLAEAKTLKPDLAIIMLSGHGTIDTAVEATRKGAYDFLEKPPDLNRLLLSIRHALERDELVQQTRQLRRKVAGVQDIVGSSDAIQAVKDTIARVAPTEARVLITGENGTGKELIARWLHEQSARAKGPMVEVNCAAIPAELIESELFGHVKGAFTSAVKDRAGKFEQAHGGTLFLDEIGDMSPDTQAKVLRALQDSRITRVGGDKPIPVDVRVVAATNKDLQTEIAEGRFREDLYHRLSVILIESPPLRARPGDIPQLARHFAQSLAQDHGYAPRTLADDALQALSQLPWTGNVRELRNVVERLLILGGNPITAQDVATYASPSQRTTPAAPSAAGPSPANTPQAALQPLFGQVNGLQDLRDQVEAAYIRHQLEANQWNVTKTAEALEIQRSHLYNKMEKYGLSRG